MATKAPHPAPPSLSQPSPSQPTLSQLRALIAVADAGGFGEAAAELGVSQSSLSEAVGRLEDLVGGPLLRRTPSGTRPTPAGERALPHARAAVLAAGDVLLAAQDDHELSGVLRVASFRSTATHLLPPVLAAFRRQHPGVRVDVLDNETLSDGPEALLAGYADLAIVVLRDHPALKLTPLCTDDYVFVAPLQRPAQALSFEELRASHLILPPGRTSCHVLLRRYLGAHQALPEQIEEIEQDSVILSMVRHGLGVTIMPRMAVEPTPAGLETQPLPEPLARPLSVAALPNRAHLPLIRAFTAALVASLGERVPSPPGRREESTAPLLH